MGERKSGDNIASITGAAAGLDFESVQNGEPGRQLAQQITEYIRLHPGCTAAEIYENVPNCASKEATASMVKYITGRKDSLVRREKKPSTEAGRDIYFYYHQEHDPLPFLEAKLAQVSTMNDALTEANEQLRIENSGLQATLRASEAQREELSRKHITQSAGFITVILDDNAEVFKDIESATEHAEHLAQSKMTPTAVAVVLQGTCQPVTTTEWDIHPHERKFPLTNSQA